MVSIFIDKVATIKAVINSVKGLKKFSNEYEPILVNVCGEFDNYKNELDSLNIKVVDLTFFSYHKYLPYKGYIFSRISFSIIFLISFLPLIFLIKSKKPDFFICHLITSLPILVSNITNSRTEYILRISGLPIYGQIRKFFWRKFGKKISKITCPTQGTLDDLSKNNIFDINKLFLLRDPIIEIKKKKFLHYKNTFDKDDYSIISVGRLTKQKNFQILINNFDKMLELKKNIKLFIIGDGEQKNSLDRLIIKKDLSNKGIFIRL